MSTADMQPGFCPRSMRVGRNGRLSGVICDPASCEYAISARVITESIQSGGTSIEGAEALANDAKRPGMFSNCPRRK